MAASTPSTFGHSSLIASFGIGNLLLLVLNLPLIGAIGYALSLARFNPALLLLGFVQGPLIETSLRRALLISRGDPMVFLERPIAAVFVLVLALLLAMSLVQAIRRKARRGRQR